MGALSGKVAIVTGAASGIGRASAKLFASEGANVLLADINSAAGEEAAAEATKTGARCLFRRADVSSESDVAALIETAVSTFGGLDVMFNNAGIEGAYGSLEDISADDWDRTLVVCLKSVFLGIKHSVPALRARGGGVIVSTASIAGLIGAPVVHAYGAAKAAIINLTRSAAMEYAADGIRVNCIAPGGIVTPIVYEHIGGSRDAATAALSQAQPIPRAGMPDDIAQAALFLASAAASFITGHTLVVDGGSTAGPPTYVRRPGQPRVRGERGFVGPSFERPAV